MSNRRRQHRLRGRRSKNPLQQIGRLVRRVLRRAERDNRANDLAGRRTNGRLLRRSALFVLALSALAWLGHSWQMHRLANQFYAAGMAAMRAEDWPGADRIFRQFLSLKPNDVDALRSVALVNEHLIFSPADLSRATRFYSLAVAAAPSDRELRLRLGKLQLATAPDQSLVIADALVEEQPNDPVSFQLRAQALDRLWTKDESNQASAEEVLAAYRDWIGADAGNPAPSLRLATLCVQHTKRLAKETGRPESEHRLAAVRLGEQLVAKYPDRPEAYLGRYAIRKLLASGAPTRTADDDLPSDIMQALTLAPEHVEANLAAAQEICPQAFGRGIGEPFSGDVAKSTLRRAQSHLTTAQRASPHDERSYLALAELGCLGGDRAGARRVLQVALTQVVHPSPMLHLRAAEEAIGAQEWDDAAQQLRVADQTARRVAAGTDAIDLMAIRRDYLALRDLLSARILAAEDRLDRDVAAATALLEKTTSLPASQAIERRLWQELAALYDVRGLTERADAIRQRLNRGANASAVASE